MQNIARQIQAIIATLEDAKYTNKDLFLTYIDFKNSFGFIDNPRLLAIMGDLGYPIDAIMLIRNMYSKPSISFRGTHFITNPPIQISHGTIQGDTLSPYLFNVFLEPLLRWLEKTT